MTTPAIRAEREFLNALLAHLQEGIVACDADGVLTLFNDASKRFHGLPAEPLPAERWAEHYDLFHSDGRRMAPEEIPLFRALRGEVVHNVEMVIAPHGGKRRVLLANGQAIKGRDGDLLGAVVAMHDITELKQAEAERVQLAAERAAREAAEATNVRLALLAEASEHVSQSVLDEQALGVVAGLMVPLAGERCKIAVDDGPTVEAGRRREGEQVLSERLIGHGADLGSVELARGADAVSFHPEDRWLLREVARRLATAVTLARALSDRSR